MTLVENAPNVMSTVILFFSIAIAFGLAGIVLKIFGIGKNGD